jgi:hypothetical protein
MIAEEGGKVVGNMSSNNNNQGGVAEASNVDFDPQHLKPTQIIIPKEAENAKITRTRVKYSEEEAQHMLKIADAYQAQATRNEEIANDGLVNAGLQEMQLAHENGTLTYEGGIAIAEKYGKGNPKVYAALKGAIGTYVAAPRATGGGSGGSGGSGGGQGGRLTQFKSMIGRQFNSFSEFINYCNSNGISLSINEQNSMSKAFNDYTNGTGEFKPEFTINMDNLARRSGIDKDAFINNAEVIQRSVAGWAAEFESQQGREPTQDEMYAYAITLVTSRDESYGRTRADQLSAGIKDAYSETGDDGETYWKIYWTDGTESTVHDIYYQQLLNGETTEHYIKSGQYK